MYSCFVVHGVYRLYLVMVARVQALRFLPLKPTGLSSSSVAVLAVAVCCDASMKLYGRLYEFHPHAICVLPLLNVVFVYFFIYV
jgi:hypothetical protein